MAKKKKDQASRSAFEDYSYQESLNDITSMLPGEGPGDTPDEALRKFRQESMTRDATPQEQRNRKPKALRVVEQMFEPSDPDKAAQKKRRKAERAARRAAKRAQGRTTIIPAWLRNTVLTLVTVILVGFMLLIGLNNFLTVDESTNPLVRVALTLPERLVPSIVAPVQDAFSAVSNGLFSYFRTVKRRQSLEEAYEALLQENEQLFYRALQADELAIQLSQLEDIYDEVKANMNMQPIVATVIGRDNGNYFSSFTVNKGTKDGIETFMAVTMSGSLIGYVETVSDTSSTVRTIIDSEASIAALIQSSRDQGVISGTLGIDGQPLCRMYYLPDDNLPRPGDTVVTSGVGMSFPKGIPIGTVRESTRRMDQNKSYVVVEPSADFEHIEYVTIYKYQPPAEAIQSRDNASAYMGYVATETARPYPTLQIGSSLYFLATATPEETVTPTPAATETPEPTQTPVPKRTAVPNATPSYTGEIYEFNPLSTGPTPTPSPTPSPSPTPFITIGPGDLTWEEE